MFAKACNSALRATQHQSQFGLMSTQMRSFRQVNNLHEVVYTAQAELA